jgi:hypothetical protein
MRVAADRAKIVICTHELIEVLALEFETLRFLIWVCGDRTELDAPICIEGGEILISLSSIVCESVKKNTALTIIRSVTNTKKAIVEKRTVLTSSKHRQNLSEKLYLVID